MCVATATRANAATNPAAVCAAEPRRVGGVAATLLQPASMLSVLGALEIESRDGSRFVR
jgi:hypothetical protein